MTTIRTGNRRLLKLADKLDSLPPARFKYSSWVGDDWKGKPDLSCGTTACAIGWGTTMPVLRRAGLGLYGIGTPMVKVDAEEARLCGMSEGEKTNSYYSIGRQLFAIDSQQFADLFMAGGNASGSDSDWNKSAKEIAKRIRDFVDSRIADERRV